MPSDVEMFDQVDNQYKCPSCGNTSYHLAGVFKQETDKYTHVLHVLECESCLSKYGTMDSYGKGGSYRSNVGVNHVRDWVRVI